MSLHSQTIDSFELARASRQIDGCVNVADLLRLSSLLADSSGALHYRVTGVADVEGQPGAQLQLTGLLRLTCQRCNEPLEFQLDRAVLFRFMASEEALNAMPIQEEEIDAVVGSRTMNVRDWIEDEAMLSLPLVARHDECLAASSTPDFDPVEVANPFAALSAMRDALNGDKSKT